MNSERNRDLEKFKWQILLRMLEGSVSPPRKALAGVAGQKSIIALEAFLHEVFLNIRDEVLLNHLLPKSLTPEILREERKLIQPGTSKIGIVTVGSMKNKPGSSQDQSVPVPILHLCGTYLECNGFDIGAQVGVFSRDKELILRPLSGCEHGCDQSAGGDANG